MDEDVDLFKAEDNSAEFTKVYKEGEYSPRDLKPLGTGKAVV